MIGACGILFDQEVVSALLKLVPLYPKARMMKLSDGRQCVIVENSGIHNIRPVVRLMDGTSLDLNDMHNSSLTLLPEKESDTFLPSYEEGRQEMTKEFRKYRVLIVDDMMTNLQMMRGILEYLYDVTLVKSGKQALAYLAKNEYPDVIIMDIDMPDMSGIDAVKRINELTNKSVPVLFVTAISDHDTVAMCQSLGAAGYVIRPYKPAYIKAEIKRILLGRGDAE